MNATGTVRLETERLILRRFTLEDANEMYLNWASDPEVTKFLTWPTHTSVEVTKSVLSDWIDRYDDPDFYSWAIELKQNSKVVGSIAAVSLNKDIGAADIGYCLGKAYWNSGIMTEALRAVIGHLFDSVGLNRIAAYHDPDNPASGRVMEKAGMKLEGILRQAGRNNSGVSDRVYHSIIRSDRA